MRKDDGMRIPISVAACLCVWALGFGPSARAADDSQEQDMSVRLDQSCREGAAGTTCTLAGIERRQVFEDVVEYSLRIRVGPGTYDFITLHRVVREQAPWSPIRTPKAVFLVHGDAWGFRGAFMPSVASEDVPRQQSFAIFLAKQGLDVWGIDLRWVNVPVGTTDFSFMKDWNLAVHAKDVGTGLGLARIVRAFGFSGAGPLALLGWSRGAMVSYAYLNEDVKLPQDKRNVSAFIPVDMAFTFAPEQTALREFVCGLVDSASASSSGSYASGVGQLLQTVGSLAVAAPDAPSPVVPLLTNRQTELLAGAATYTLQSPAILNGYHFTGGAFSSVVPTSLTWTRERFFADILMQASPYQSMGEQVETLVLWCGKQDLPYDDRLSQVTVPVLYVGATGGVGQLGVYSARQQLRSRDFSSLIVQRLSTGGGALDYGHADLFFASDAEQQVWRPVLNWLQNH